MTDDQTETIPFDILVTLFRGLTHCAPGQITSEQKEAAWAWLEKHNHYDWMGM